MLKTLKLREAHEDDAIQITNLHKRVIREVHAHSYPIDRIETWAQSISVLTTRERLKKDHFLVEVKEKHDIIGFVHFDDSGKIFQIYIEPLWSGKGVGSSLLKETERLLIEKRIAKAIIISSENSVPFFKHRGYTIYKKMHLHMTKIPVFE